MPAQYIILYQGQPGTKCTVTFYDNDKQTSEVLFEGGRVAAKKFLKSLLLCVGWENITTINERIGRGGRRVCTVINP